MKKNDGHISRGRYVPNYASAAIEQMELYCVAHPGSPSAVRRPQLFFRSELWIALLGPSIEEGIVGIGSTIAAALRAFDTQYLAGIRPPVEALGSGRAARRSFQIGVKLSQRSFGFCLAILIASCRIILAQPPPRCDAKTSTEKDWRENR